MDENEGEGGKGLNEGGIDFCRLCFAYGDPGRERIERCNAVLYE